MHIETLKVFCDLADLRSFSKVAEKHATSQSAISQHLAQLKAAHKCYANLILGSSLRDHRFSLVAIFPLPQPLFSTRNAKVFPLVHM